MVMAFKIGELFEDFLAVGYFFGNQLTESVYKLLIRMAIGHELDKRLD